MRAGASIRLARRTEQVTPPWHTHKPFCGEEGHSCECWCDSYIREFIQSFQPELSKQQPQRGRLLSLSKRKDWWQSQGRTAGSQAILTLASKQHTIFNETVSENWGKWHGRYIIWGKEGAHGGVYANFFANPRKGVRYHLKEICCPGVAWTCREWLRTGFKKPARPW